MIRRTGGWLAAALSFGVLSWALLELPATPTRLAQQAHGSLDQSGVSNPVTAVLLNYRGYDTLLEVAVLLLAIVAVWSLRSTPTARGCLPGRRLAGRCNRTDPVGRGDSRAPAGSARTAASWSLGGARDLHRCRTGCHVWWRAISGVSQAPRQQPDPARRDRCARFHRADVGCPLLRRETDSRLRLSTRC